MEKKIYIGLLDAGQKKQEAVVQKRQKHTQITRQRFSIPDLPTV